MIKSELVQRISEQNPHLYQRDVENIVNAILGEIIAAMARGDRVELRGFGAFSVKNRPARTGRNPRTGAHVSVDQKIRAVLQAPSSENARTAQSIRRALAHVPANRFRVAGPWKKPMIRKVVSAVILIPLGLMIVALAVVNREVVTVSFDPFNTNPSFALRAPLFVLVFVLVIVGVIIGGVAAWLRQSAWRRAARQLEADLRAARAEADRLRERLAAGESASRSQSLALHPPAA